MVSNASASPSSVSAGGSFTITFDITDASGVDQVFISVNGVDVSCDPAALSSGSVTNGTWSASCTVGALVGAGSYSIDVSASDIASNYGGSTSIPYNVV